MIPRRAPSPEINTTKPKSKGTQLKSSKDENSSENVAFSFGMDEKFIIDTWQTAVLAISNMVRHAFFLLEGYLAVRSSNVNTLK